MINRFYDFGGLLGYQDKNLFDLQEFIYAYGDKYR